MWLVHPAEKVSPSKTTRVDPRKYPLQLLKDAGARWTEETIDAHEEKREICRVVICVNLWAEHLVEERQSGGIVTVGQYET